MEHLDPVARLILWSCGIGASLAAIITIHWKIEEIREDRRGWRLWVVAPFFRYQEKDSRGGWTTPVDFNATWEFRGHSQILKSICVPSAANWLKSPEWAISRRQEIVAHLKERYPKGVNFIEEEPNQSPEPMPLTRHGSS